MKDSTPTEPLITSKADYDAAMADYNATMENLRTGLEGAFDQMQEELKLNPEKAVKFFKDLAKEGPRRDYFKNPRDIALLKESLRFAEDFRRGVPTPEERTSIMENFFQEWCVKCPILQHFTQPESDLEDTAGALCPDETLDTCPILLQLRDVRAITAPNPSATQNPDTNIKGDDSNASTTN